MKLGKDESKITESKLRHATSLKRRRNESAETFYKRITNLNLQEKGLTDIENFATFNLPSIRVLYLFQNCINKISVLDSFSQLTHVYLQNNKIERIEGFSYALHLVKLRLDYNRIKVVEGLRNCSSLQEFHISNQRLELGESLEFDISTLENLADSLTTLDVSGNRIQTIMQLSCLTNLQSLKAENNYVMDITQVKSFLERCCLLYDLTLTGNPISDLDGYRDYVIMNSEFLHTLDSIAIPPNQRAFLQARENRRAQKREIAKRRLYTQTSLESLSSQSPHSLMHSDSISHISHAVNTENKRNTFRQFNSLYRYANKTAPKLLGASRNAKSLIDAKAKRVEQNYGQLSILGAGALP